MYIQNETCTAELPPTHELTKYHSTVVKRFIPPSEENATNTKMQLTSNQLETPLSAPKHAAGPQALTLACAKGEKKLLMKKMEELVASTAKIIFRSKDHAKYTASCEIEIDGLINREVIVLAI